MLSDFELQVLWLSLKVALRSVAFALPFAVAAAWVLAQKGFPGKDLFDGVIHLPLVLPPVVVGYLLLLTFGVRGPLGAWLYDTFGLRLVFTSLCASVVTALMSFPLMVRAICVDRGH